ncbi:MAG: hypothetical protein QME12_07985 [Nanoarchaeota archaeon]|nr:hypothetical protein [Nanoarchaeota archaeon]
MNQKIQCFSIQSMGELKGFVKNGIDSSTLINLIVVFHAEFDEFRARGFTFPPNLFHYHEASYSEVIGVLINKHGFSKEKAKESFEKLKQEFGLQEIKRIDSDEDYEKRVKETNKEVVRKEDNPKLEIGCTDSVIIGGFLRARMNIIHSGDEGFLKTCKAMDMNIAPMPERDIIKENEIKKLLKKR